MLARTPFTIDSVASWEDLDHSKTLIEDVQYQVKSTKNPGGNFHKNETGVIVIPFRGFKNSWFSTG